MDRDVSGAKDRRPALDALLKEAKRRRFDGLVCWRLERLERNLRHLVTFIEELQTLGIAFVSLGEGIDCTTPAGKLQLHILAALAEFERERIREGVLAGLQRARMQGNGLDNQETRPALRCLFLAALYGLRQRSGALRRRLLRGGLAVDKCLVHLA